jgi:hypothetical protein
MQSEHPHPAISFPRPKPTGAVRLAVPIAACSPRIFQRSLPLRARNFMRAALAAGCWIMNNSSLFPNYSPACPVLNRQRNNHSVPSRPNQLSQDPRASVAGRTSGSIRCARTDFVRQAHRGLVDRRGLLSPTSKLLFKSRNSTLSAGVSGCAIRSPLPPNRNLIRTDKLLSPR